MSVLYTLPFTVITAPLRCSQAVLFSELSRTQSVTKSLYWVSLHHNIISLENSFFSSSVFSGFSHVRDSIGFLLLSFFFSHYASRLYFNRTELICSTFKQLLISTMLSSGYRSCFAIFSAFFSLVSFFCAVMVVFSFFCQY